MVKCSICAGYSSLLLSTCSICRVLFVEDVFRLDFGTFTGAPFGLWQQTWMDVKTSDRKCSTTGGNHVVNLYKYFDISLSNQKESIKQYGPVADEDESYRALDTRWVQIFKLMIRCYLIWFVILWFDLISCALRDVLTKVLIPLDKEAMQLDIRIIRVHSYICWSSFWMQLCCILFRPPKTGDTNWQSQAFKVHLKPWFWKMSCHDFISLAFVKEKCQKWILVSTLWKDFTYFSCSWHIF